MTNTEIYYIVNSLKELVANHREWQDDYAYDLNTNEFHHKNKEYIVQNLVDQWFDL